MGSYFKDITEGVKSTLSGMGLTFRHALDARNRRKASDVQLSDFFEVSSGMVTVQYPKETVPIPDHGRYRLHNEMDDCIVCDKCAKVCPVDCIEIEPIKATEEVGRASDGSVIRLYAAKFDIDMAKCCYCGLCTTVCPTESLTMTKTFDYSEFDVREMIYAYGNLSAEQAQEKRDLLEQFQLEKARAKELSAAVPAAPAAKKPAFRPSMKPKTTAVTQDKSMTTQAAETTRTHLKFHPKNWDPKQEKGIPPLSFTLNTNPVIRPETPPPTNFQSAEKAASGGGFKPKMKPKSTADNISEQAPKPAFRPTMKPKDVEAQSVENDTQPAPKPAFRPTMKPKGVEAQSVESKTQPAPKPAFRPTIKPKSVEGQSVESKTQPAPKPAFRPTMKPKSVEAQSVESKTQPAPKPAFRPTIKPKSVEGQSVESKTQPAPKPAFRPTIKPKNDPEESPVVSPKTKGKTSFQATFHPRKYINSSVGLRPAFAYRKPGQPAKPTPVPAPEATVEVNDKKIAPPVADKPRSVFRPTMKPKK